MDLKLAGKTALITGGSKGIGRATAEVFAAEGCNVIIVSRTAETLAQVKSAIAQKSNVRVDTVAADLSDSKNVDRLAQDYPDIDILINNAGAIPGGTLLNVDEATWRKAWDLKVFGYVNMCRRFYALMKERKRGVIVNVVGNAADTHDPGIHLRRRRQCGADRVQPVARLRQRKGRHPCRRAQSRPGGDRPHRHADEEEGEGPHRRREQLAGAAQAAAVPALRHARGDRRDGGVPGVAAVRLHLRFGRDHRRRSLGARNSILNRGQQCRI